MLINEKYVFDRSRNSAKNVSKNSSSKIIDTIILEQFYINNLNRNPIDDKFNIPHFNNKENVSEVDLEIRKSSNKKPPIIFSKFPAVFEFSRSKPKRNSMNKDIPTVLINKIKEVNIEKDKNFNINHNNNRNSVKENNLYHKYILGPIRTKSGKKDTNGLKNILISNLENLETEFKVEEVIHETMLKRVLLKPIEIKDPRKCTPLQLSIAKVKDFNIDTLNINENYCRSYMSKSLEKTLAKTSEFNFKLLEDMNLEKLNTEFPRIDESTQNPPKEILKNLLINRENMTRNKNRISNYYSVLDKGCSLEVKEKSKREINVFNDNFNIHNNKKLENYEFQLRFDQIITLNIIKSNQQRGNIKKILHVPSLKIYTIREVPLINKEVRNLLNDQLNLRKSLRGNKSCVEIYGYYMNTPEGFDSIIMEYCSYGTLQNLINSIGSIPELILKQLTIKIITSLEQFYLRTGGVYGSLTANNIFLDNKCNLKLSIGISQILNKYKENLKNMDEIKIKENLIFHWMEENSINNPNAYLSKLNDITFIKQNLTMLNLLRKIDFFDLGYLLINCAIGQFEILDITNYTCNHKIENIDCCCLYHCISRHEKGLNAKYKLKLTNFLNEMLFSVEFIDFICSLTSFKYDKKFSLSLLKKHKWIQEDNNANYPISLQELLKHSQEFCIKNEYLIRNDNSMKRFDKLCENISLILPHCKEYFSTKNFSDFSSNILKCNLVELSKEMGIEKEIIVNKLKSIFDNLRNSVN